MNKRAAVRAALFYAALWAVISLMTARISGSGPFRHGRQAHEDRINIAAGFQAEQGAAIMDQVKFNIAAPPFIHRFILFGCRGHAHAAAHDHGEYIQKGFAHCAREFKIAVKFGVVMAFQMIIKNAAHAPRDIAVRDEEIFLSPFGIARISIWPKWRAGRP
jgi:hypothetical protein